MGFIALALLSATGCNAGPGAGAESSGSIIVAPPTASSPAASSPAASRPAASTAAAEPGRGQAEAPAPAATLAQANFETALRRAFEGGKPGAGEVRAALVAGGFAAGDVQVTAGRTPTGLEADAVEIGVRQGGDCLVAQVRNGAVSVTVLPVLADGRCLVGVTVP
jgi:hypothetical protein